MIERDSEATPLAPAPAPIPAGDLSGGQMLRRLRESHGLTIEAVAAGMKVPVKKMVALEADDIDALPDPVFARALAASVCRALRADPAPILAKLPGAPRAALADADRTMSSHIRAAAPSHARAGLVGRPSRAVLAVVGLLLVGALVLFLLPQAPTEQVAATWSRMTGDGSAPPAEGGDGTNSGTVVQPSLPGAAGQPANATATTTATSVITGPVASSTAPAGTAAPASSTTPSTVIAPALPATTGAAATATATPTPASTDPLVIVARDDVWVRVGASGGRKLMERLVKAGETVAVPDAPPLSVTVGRAGAVSVQVKGQPFDLAPVTRAGGVARFEVQP